MAIDIRKHMLPLAVTGGALVLAVIVGLVPVLSSSDDESGEATADTIAALQARIAELEAAEPTASAPAGPDARTRQELDLIVKGLGNQTGRVSRLKAQMEPLTDWQAAGGPVRLADEMALINKALANQTRRVAALKSELEAITEWQAAGGPARLAQELALINKALLNQTGRISALANQVETLPQTTATVDRLTLQVQNLERAVTNLHRRQSASTVTAPAPASGDIEAKLDAILNALAER